MRPWADRTCDLSQSTSEEQQSALMVHRARARTMANRTAQVNQIRGLLGEFGFVVFALPGRTAGQTAPPLRGDAQKNDVESRSGNETRESHREPQDSPGWRQQLLSACCLTENCYPIASCGMLPNLFRLQFQINLILAPVRAAKPSRSLPGPEGRGEVFFAREGCGSVTRLVNSWALTGQFLPSLVAGF